MRVLTIADAEQQGLRRARPEEQRLLSHLLRFLAEACFATQQLPDTLKAAIDEVVSIINLTPEAFVAKGPLIHICECSAACACCGRTPTELRDLLMRSLRALLFRGASSPSETRWTSMLPGLAYCGSWLAIRQLGAVVVSRSLGRRASDLARRPAVIGDADEWRKNEEVRLRKALRHLSSSNTFVNTLIGVLANQPVQRMLHALLKYESEYHGHPDKDLTRSYTSSGVA